MKNVIKNYLLVLIIALHSGWCSAKRKISYPNRPPKTLMADNEPLINQSQPQQIPQQVLPAPAHNDPQIPNSSAVTYNFSGGRFGDNLVAYLHAKWIAFQYNIPLLYKPFPYSDQLMLHEVETALYEADKAKFAHHVTLRRDGILNISPNSSTLYTVPYFPECLQEHEHCDDYIYFEVDWNNSAFFKEICALIKPRFPLTTLELPKDRITVAVHVRKRTAEFDGPVLFEQKAATSWEGYADRAAPFKFATDEYYQEQIKRVSAFFGHQPLYVYLFTDSPNPIALVEAYKEAIQLPNIEFDCRKTTNNHRINVLEDFFSLPKFDCLIRVDSNFSLTAAKLTRYKIIATPKHHHFHPTKGYPVIDQVTFTVTT